MAQVMTMTFLIWITDTDKARRLIGNYAQYTSQMNETYILREQGMQSCCSRSFCGRCWCTNTMDWSNTSGPMPFASHAVVYVTTPTDYSCQRP